MREREEYIFQIVKDYDGICHYIKQGMLIRCKDCRHWDTIRQNDDLSDYHYCPIAKTFHRADFYCGGAERRTDESD